MTLEELQAQKAALEATLIVQEASVDASEARVASLQSQLVGAQGEVVVNQAAVADTRSKLAAVQAQIDAWVPPTPASKTLLGISGSSEIAGACQRSFSGGKIAVVSRPTKTYCPRFHHSWGGVVNTGGTINTVTDTQMKAALINFLPGDEVEVEHEMDAKDAKGAGPAMLAARIKAKADFYAQVKRVRPDLFVVHTLMSYSFEPSKFGAIEKYYAKADVLGADLDGGAFPHNYGEPKRLTNIVNWAIKHYGGVWTCPEFGWNNDPQGARMAQITSQIAAIAKFGPKEISYHNNPNFGATLTAAELTQYTALVHQYNS